LPELELEFGVDHPASRGHFPDNPVIPGAVLLSDTLEAVARTLALDLTMCAVSVAKFPSAARPGDRVLVEFTQLAGRVQFTCRVDSRTVLTGALVCRGAPTQE
jgi:3-hydroxymyristoyl/3-hydroxydecanoyl-(acyl carrier protein) dehydratase